uniref:Uncharacterized protein n=1 Tax=Arundo donax TaxID=35708 RepID=A0A0A9A6W4_ARUDO
MKKLIPQQIYSQKSPHRNKLLTLCVQVQCSKHTKTPAATKRPVKKPTAT